jgi:hypothetical protein
MQIEIQCNICWEVNHETKNCPHQEEMKKCNHERIRTSYDPETMTPFYECVDCKWWQIG